MKTLFCSGERYRSLLQYIEQNKDIAFLSYVGQAFVQIASSLFERFRKALYASLYSCYS